MKTESEYRKDIVEVCKRIHGRGWISSTDGNVSVRLGRDRILITPTAIHKGYMTERDLIITDMEGKLIAGSRKPSSEICLHLTCYRERPDVNAVVHAHPTMCVALSLAGVSLAKCLLPEVIFTLGSIPTAEYAPPTTEKVAESVKKYIKEFDAVILERHGSVTVGADVFSAYNTLERMEHVAEMTYYARQIGNVKPLSEQQIAHLQSIGDKQGWPRKKLLEQACNNCNACGKHNNSGSCGGHAQNEQAVQAAAPSADYIEKLIVEEVRAALKRN
ncbi:MAG: class II aldolase/adducin family protein [Nitrospinae bacterium]|nr:class II aldolase/adducin family protein [Nitrospinota bacterium]